MCWRRVRSCGIVRQFDLFRWQEVIYRSGYRDRSFARIPVTNWYGWIAPALDDMQPSVSDARRYFWPKGWVSLL